MRRSHPDLSVYRSAPARGLSSDPGDADPPRVSTESVEAPVAPAAPAAGGAHAAPTADRRVGRPARLLRLGIAAALALVWLAAMGLGGPTFGKISEVSSNDQSTFLPASAESTLAGEAAAGFRDGSLLPAIIVGEASTADPATSFPALAALAERLGEVEGVESVAGPIPSEDGEAVQFLAFIPTGDEASRETTDVVDDLRAVLDDPGAVAGVAGSTAADAQWHVGGPGGLSTELGGAFAGIDGLLLIVALVVVFVILVAVYRSVLLPVLVLFTSVGALSVSILAVYWMARADWIQLNGQSQGILSILVIGATTDYCLLLVARHREELLAREAVGPALLSALRGSFGAITASAATVAAALLILLVSDLNSNRSLGPIAASGIVFAWLAALTLLPALLQLTGRAAFWPTIPSPANAAKREERRAAKGKGYVQPVDRNGEPLAGLEDDHGVWTRIAAFVARHARPVWIATAAVLLALAAGVTQLQASGIAQTDVLLGESDSREAQSVLSAHFDAGAGSPAEVVAPEAARHEVLEIVRGTDGVASAEFKTEQVEAPAGPPAAAQPEAAPAPVKVVDGRVLVSATLSDPADSLEGERTVAELRTALDGVDGEVLVGGTAAQSLDSNETAQRDLRLVIPLVLLVVLLILMALLRSVVAPVLLVLATVLSFGSALGVSTLVFQHVLGFENADPTVPLYGFVFLVALGIDYTIFLMTRAREETPKLGSRAAVLRSLTVTGGVITSAGVVLAATFATLSVIPLMFMVQLAFIVAFGVLLDTLVVRSLLIPALVRDIGPKVWWPARIG